MGQPDGSDESIENSPSYQQALELTRALGKRPESKAFEPAIKLLEQEYESANARTNQLNARAQAIVGLVSVLSSLILGGIGSVLIAPPDKINPCAYLFALVFAFVGTLLLAAIAHALRAMGIVKYQHYMLDPALLKEQDVKLTFKKIRADVITSLIPATAYNEERNDYKAACLKYSYRYLAAALWLLLVTVFVGSVWFYFRWMCS